MCYLIRSPLPLGGAPEMYSLGVTFVGIPCGYLLGDPLGGSRGGIHWGGLPKPLGILDPGGPPGGDPQGISLWIPWGIPTRESLTGYPGGCWGAVPSQPCRECGADVEIAILSCRHLPQI